MKTVASSSLALALLFQNSAVFAGNSPSSSSTSVEIPQNFEQDGEVYDLSVSGFRAYLTGLRTQDKNSLADVIEPSVREFETKRKTAMVVAGAFMLGGIASSYYSAQYKDDLPGKSDVGSPNFMKDDEAEVKQRYVLIGIGLVGAGIISYNILSPSRDDFMDLINVHNRAAKKINAPLIRINLGLVPLENPMAVFKMSWNL